MKELQAAFSLAVAVFNMQIGDVECCINTTS